MSDDELFNKIMRRLGDFIPLRGRKMFGGIGIYSGDVMFALIYDNEFYLRSSEYLAKEYAGSESVQFQPPPKKVKMPYWSVPEKIIEDRAKFLEWVGKALSIAESTKKR